MCLLAHLELHLSEQLPKKGVQAKDFSTKYKVDGTMKSQRVEQGLLKKRRVLKFILYVSEAYVKAAELHDEICFLRKLTAEMVMDGKRSSQRSSRTGSV